jgi:hypothetical protein
MTSASMAGFLASLLGRLDWKRNLSLWETDLPEWRKVWQGQNGLIRQARWLDLSLNHWVAFLRRVRGINCVDLELLSLLRLSELSLRL